MRWVSAAGFSAVIITAIATTGVQASSHTEVLDGLDLVSQTFAVPSGGFAQFEFIMSVILPEMVAVPTTTATTTEPVPGPETTVLVRAHTIITSHDDLAIAAAGNLGREIDVVEFPFNQLVSCGGTPVECSLNLTVPVSDSRETKATLGLDLPGLYPITVEVRRDGQLIAGATTFIERLRDDGITRGLLSMAVVAVVKDLGPEPSELDLVLVRPQLAEIAALGEALEAPITVLIPPIYTKRILRADTALADRLRAALSGSDVLVSPSMQLDPSSAAGAGLRETFINEYELGVTQLRQAFPDSHLQRGVWITHSLPTAEGAAMLRSIGTSVLVMPFDIYATLGGNIGDYTDTTLLLSAQLENNTSMPIALTNPTMSLIDPDRETLSNPAQDAVRLMAYISVLRSQFDPNVRGLVLATPALEVPDADVLVHIERYANEHPEIDMTSLAELGATTNPLFVNGTELIVTLPEAPVVDLVDRLQRVNDLRMRVLDIGSMLPTDDQRVGEWNTSLDKSLSTGFAAREANDRLEIIGADLTNIRSAVEPPDSFSFTLTGSDSPIPLRIANTGPTPLTIVVRVKSEKLVSRGSDSVVVLAANSVTDVPLEVTARTSGIFTVVVELLTPSGSRLGEPVVLTARANTLTGLGRALTAGGLLTLGVWWLAYFRRHRAAVASEAPNPDTMP